MFAYLVPVLPFGKARRFVSENSKSPDFGSGVKPRSLRYRRKISCPFLQDPILRRRKS